MNQISDNIYSVMKYTTEIVRELSFKNYEDRGPVDGG